MPEHEAARVAAGDDQCTHVGRAVMHAAERSQRFGVVVAAFRAWLDVMQIEVLRVATPGRAALASVALEHASPLRGRDRLRGTSRRDWACFGLGFRGTH